MSFRKSRMVMLSFGLNARALGWVQSARGTLRPRTGTVFAQIPVLRVGAWTLGHSDASAACDSAAQRLPQPSLLKSDHDMQWHPTQQPSGKSCFRTHGSLAVQPAFLTRPI